MISYKHKFICFRIGKSASSSIREVLRPYCNGKHGKQLSIRTNVKSVMGNLKKQRLDEEKWKNYFKFTFVRNPWDRMISGYFYIQKINKQLNCDIKFDGSNEDILKFIKYNFYGVMPKNQYDFLSDKNGIMQMDFIGKVENIQKDFEHIFKTIGINCPNIIHTNKSKHNEYRYYYNDESIELVRQKCKKDIDFFNYSF